MQSFDDITGGNQTQQDESQADIQTGYPPSEGIPVTSVQMSDNSTDFKPGKPIFKQWWFWLIAGLVALILIAGGVFGVIWLQNQTKMPDVVGLSPYEAQTRVRQCSENWIINVVTDKGISAEILDNNSYSGYKVSLTDPVMDTALDKRSSNLTVVVTIKKTEETLAADKAVRDAAIQAEIDDSLANGWASEDYIDEGNLIIFKSVSPYPASQSPGTSLELHELNKQLYYNLAQLTQANILALGVTSDGYLSGVSTGTYSQSTDEERQYAAQRAAQLITGAEAAAKDNKNAIIQSAIDYEVSSGGGAGEYLYSGIDVTIYLYSQYRDPIWGDGSAHDTQGAQLYYESWAKGLAQICRCRVTINYYANDKVSLILSASAECPPWL